MRARYFATAPRGFEDLLALELDTLGALKIRQTPGGVHFDGTLETGYRACLWSRLSEHVLLQIARFQANSPENALRGNSRDPVARAPAYVEHPGRRLQLTPPGFRAHAFLRPSRSKTPSSTSFVRPPESVRRWIWPTRMSAYTCTRPRRV